MSDYGSYFDPDGVRDLAVSILAAKGESPDKEGWSIRDLCILQDWMHANIRYRRDIDQYDQSHFVAGPPETLKAGTGDCEDQALVFGSLCLAISRAIR